MHAFDLFYPSVFNGLQTISIQHPCVLLLSINVYFQTNMSLVDDEDFALKVVDKTAQVVGGELAKIRKEFAKRFDDQEKITKSLQDKVDELTTEVNTLKQKVEHQDQPYCEQVVMQAFAAGLAAISHPLPTQQFPVEAHAPTQTVATPAQFPSQPVPSTSGVRKPQKRLSGLVTSTPKKRARIQCLEDADPKLRKMLEPFYRHDKQAQQDLLNDTQRAFVKYKIKTMVDTGEKISVAFVNHTIAEGEKYGLWTDDFQPSDTSSFDRYLANRMKNEKKALQRRDRLENVGVYVAKYQTQGLQSREDSSDENE